jgi:mRNA deadenylase 3'-5' endonuclease subunit Ccr4
MAFSHKHYTLVNADIQRLVSTMKSPPAPVFATPQLSASYFAQIRSFLSSFFTSTTATASTSIATPASDVWKQVMRRKNEMISLRLTCKQTDDSFYVGTYHMPCVFRVPEVMTIHAALASQHLHRLASQQDKEKKVKISIKSIPTVSALASEDEKYSSQTTDANTTTATATTGNINKTENESKQQANGTSRVLPYVLAGDFNIQPSSSANH